jgi:hypothetical protein
VPGNTKTLVDAEGAVRAWARANTAIAAAFTGGIYFGPPEGSVTFPLVRLQRVGGGPVSGDTPLDDAAISFLVWGSNKAQAAAAVMVLASEVESFLCGTAMGSGAVGLGARVTLGPVWSSDPDTDRPRYVLDCSFSIRAV